MSRTVVALLFLLQLAPGSVLAQATPQNDFKVEVFGSLGWGALSRFDDSTPFGGGTSIGGGIGFRPLSRLGLQFDVHGMTGLKESVKAAIVVSSSATYDLSTSARARPYVLGGIGMLRTGNRASTYLDRQLAADFTDVGWGVGAGIGVRVFVTRSVVLRPEVRYMNALWRSTENLSETRASMAVGYQ